MEITLDLLKKLIEEVKVLKAEYVSYQNNVLIGTDINVIYLKLTETSIDYSLYGIRGFNVKNIALFIKDCLENDLLRVYGNTLVNARSGNSVQISDIKTDETIFFSANNLISGDPRYSVELTEDEIFNKMINGKTGDGATIIYIGGYPVSLYSTLLPINKGDKTTIDIYNKGPEEATYVAKFTIEKKKKQIVEVYVRYLKI